MTERSRFWDGSVTGDAASITDDELMDRVFRAILNGTGNQGVLRGWLNELEVTDGGGLNAAVDTGGAILYGLWYENDSATTVVVPNNSTVWVVVRRSWAAQTARLTQVAALVQNPGVTYDIPLAQVTTVAGAITLITDGRDYCEFSTAMLDGTITTDAIQADAVTTAKLENQTRWISRGLSTMEADGTSPATITSSGGYENHPYRPYWSFATGAYNSVWITFQVLSDFVAASAMTVYVWTQRAGTAFNTGLTTNMRWGFSAWIAAAGGVLANNTGAATITYPERMETYTYPYYYTWTYSICWDYTERDSLGTFSPAAGDIVHMEIYRDGTHADDVYSHAGALFLIEISYTADS